MKPIYKDELQQIVADQGLEVLLENRLPIEWVIRDGKIEQWLHQYWASLQDVGPQADAYRQEIIANLKRYLDVEDINTQPASKAEWPIVLQRWLEPHPKVSAVIPRAVTEVVCQLDGERTQRCFFRAVADGLVLDSLAVNLGPNPSSEEVFKAAALAAGNNYKFSMGLTREGEDWQLKVGCFIRSENCKPELLGSRLLWISKVADYLEHEYHQKDEF